MSKTKRHKSVGHIYKRKLGVSWRHEIINVKCLYDYGNESLRFYWDYGCAFYNDQWIPDNHSCNKIYVDCWCAFSPDADVWTSYPLQSYKRNK